MTTITASAGFRLRMDASGSIPELNSYWRLEDAGDGIFLARLIKTGPYATTYFIEVGDEIAAHPDGKVTGVVRELVLAAEFALPFWTERTAAGDHRRRRSGRSRAEAPLGAVCRRRRCHQGLVAQ